MCILNFFCRNVNEVDKTVVVNNLESLALIPENEISIPETAITREIDELKKKENESADDDNDLINIERNAIFERLAKQSEGELKVKN